MNFSQALELLKQGKRITRPCYSFFLEFSDDEIWICGGDFDGKPFHSMSSDILADDWVEVVE